MKQLAAVIITKNEETNIERCISSILPVTTEVLVIDSGSTDQTIPLAKSLGAQVIETDWKGYAATKNFGHTQTTADWILSIDSDEVLYYVDGDFMSRKHVEKGMITLHPGGIPHGPHPGTVEKSIGKKGTHELAVMVDTFAPLIMTKQAFELEDPDYYKSWIE